MTAACPVCLSIDGFAYVEGGSWGFDNRRHECEVCGKFGTSCEARDDFLNPTITSTTVHVRAVLSYWIRQRQATRKSENIPLITNDLIEAVISNEIALPSPAEQATNIIRFIGDETRLTGKSLENVPAKFHATIGSIGREFAISLLLELRDHGLLVATDACTMQDYDAIDVRLNLNGWNTYEAERKGKVSGNYGFIALKFNDPVLDPFLNDHIKPTVQSIGLELRDMRDVAQAGIIDNLMRMQIRDSAFVLVDLTHDNSGAYWEAGYAEGLGKPVLYICEKSKFAAAQTHFDTNHSTTVVWDAEKPDEFKENLVATLRRSLQV